ncbi:hypothetical protein QAD02_003170 [Eretmocerus hayati]|uniref:Uncharacterized protein n=1 Tax=Eretmocerus hayati TaxID=131215 RepID=A0ACC2NLX9_9HYME|nr:hypothetical protein QAD02_003170 [Eretmocerus hayati]
MRQSNCVLYPHKIRGLPNSDAVPCYANSSLQSLLHCQNVRQRFIQHPQIDGFGDAMIEYRSNSYFDTKKLRSFARDSYNAKEQQDVAEFMMSLINQSQTLQSVFKHSLVSIRQCQACGHESLSRIEDNLILINSLPPDSKCWDLQSILRYNLDNWNEKEIICNEPIGGDGEIQENCDGRRICRGFLKEKTRLASKADVLIIQFQIFSSEKVFLKKTRGIPSANGKRTVLNSYQNSNWIVAMPRENILGKNTVIAGSTIVDNDRKILKPYSNTLLMTNSIGHSNKEEFTRMSLGTFGRCSTNTAHSMIPSMSNVSTRFPSERSFVPDAYTPSRSLKKRFTLQDFFSYSGPTYTQKPTQSISKASSSICPPHRDITDRNSHQKSTNVNLSNGENKRTLPQNQNCNDHELIHRKKETDIDEINDAIHGAERIPCRNEDSRNQFNSSSDSVCREKYTTTSGNWSEPVDDASIMNDVGQVTNVLTAFSRPGKSSKYWICDDYCRTLDVDVLKEVKELFYDLSQLSYRDVNEFIRDFDTCSSETAVPRGGHPISCYAEPLSCKSKFFKLDIFSPHFTNLRTVKRSIYRIKHLYECILRIGIALEGGNLIELKQIQEEMRNVPGMSHTDNKEACLDEDKLRAVYLRGIKAFKTIDLDPPRTLCVSCERLCVSHYVSPVEKHLKPTIAECLLGNGSLDLPEATYWKQLQDLYDPEEFTNSFICNHCSKYLKINKLPSLSILNNLRTETVPEEIRSSNRFEKMLIQRAKAFHCVVKLETVQKKNIPHHMKLDQEKGRTFHLPLPLKATLQKLCKDTDPINLDHELHVLIRSNPTKKKVIWEDYVDIQKIWIALK